MFPSKSVIEATLKAGRRVLTVGDADPVTPEEAALSDVVALVALSEIRDRYLPNTRRLRPSHILQLATSIAALGLLEPIVIDQRLRLVAGLHRVAACRVLAVEPGRRASTLADLCPAEEIGDADMATLADLPEAPEIDPDKIPVRVMPFDSEHDPDAALACEAAENEQRRSYSPGEVRALAERLKDRGFALTKGRPPKGVKPLIPALSAVLGRSQRQVHRLLAGDPGGKRYDTEKSDARQTKVRPAPITTIPKGSRRALSHEARKGVEAKRSGSHHLPPSATREPEPLLTPPPVEEPPPVDLPPRVVDLREPVQMPDFDDLEDEAETVEAALYDLAHHMREVIETWGDEIEPESLAMLKAALLGIEF